MPTQPQLLRLCAYIMGFIAGALVMEANPPWWAWAIAFLAGATLVHLLIKEGAVYP